MRTKLSQEITIVEVAKEANVSIATVSRVMNGTAKVSKVKKDAVYAAIKALDYIPNEAARALPKTASRNISLIVPKKMDVFKMQILTGIIDVAELNDVTINVLNPVSLKNQADEDMWLKLKQLRTSGVIVLDDGESNRTNSIIENLDIPLVFINNLKTEDEKIFLVKLDLDSFAKQIIEICSAEKFKEVQIVGQTAFNKKNVTKFTKQLEKAGLKITDNAKAIVSLKDQDLLESGMLNKNSFIFSIEGTQTIEALPHKKAFNQPAAYQVGAFATGIIGKHQAIKLKTTADIAMDNKIVIPTILKRG